jgi:hypothetical protein
MPRGTHMARQRRKRLSCRHGHESGAGGRGGKPRRLGRRDLDRPPLTGRNRRFNWFCWHSHTCSGTDEPHLSPKWEDLMEWRPSAKKSAGFPPKGVLPQFCLRFGNSIVASGADQCIERNQSTPQRGIARRTTEPIGGVNNLIYFAIILYS